MAPMKVSIVLQNGKIFLICPELIQQTNGKNMSPEFAGELQLLIKSLVAENAKENLNTFIGNNISDSDKDIVLGSIKENGLKLMIPNRMYISPLNQHATLHAIDLTKDDINAIATLEKQNTNVFFNSLPPEKYFIADSLKEGVQHEALSCGLQTLALTEELVKNYDSLSIKYKMHQKYSTFSDVEK
jgi:hypothetical protein